MTLPGRPGDPRPAQGSGEPAPDPERVLSQALRAMAGGGKQGRTEAQQRPPAGEQLAGRGPGLSVLQILLIAAIFGLLVGITIGLVTLLT